jgi:hypothetical protein
MDTTLNFYIEKIICEQATVPEKRPQASWCASHDLRRTKNIKNELELCNPYFGSGHTYKIMKKKEKQ